MPLSNDQPPAPANPPHAWRSWRAWATLLSVTALALAADLVSKRLAFQHVADEPVPVRYQDVVAVGANDPRQIGRLIPAHDPVTVVPGLLDFTLVLNPGAVFGVGPGQRWFFIVFTGAALCLGVWMFSRWTGPRDRAAHIAIGLLLGGGLGNLYDRLAFGCVRDFLHPLPGVKFPFGFNPLGNSGEVWPYVSNVADLLLLIGIGMLLVHLWRRDHGARVARTEPRS